MGTIKNWVSLAAGLVTTAVLVTGCGTMTAGTGATGPGTAGTTGGAVSTTNGPDCADEEPPAQGDFTPGAAVMIEFTEESPWDNWISLPHLVIYEDGSAVVYQRDQAQSAIPPSQVPTTSSRSTSTSDGARSQYGGLLPWAVGHVSRCELGQILTDLAGVDPEHTGFGQPQVFDASGTSVRVYGVGEATADDYDAYALAADFDEGLSAAERQARARLRAVMARTEAAVHTVGVLPVDRVEVTSLLSTTSGPYGSEATPTWPLATSPQTVRGGKRCGEVRGADAAKVAAAVPVDDRRRDPLFVGAWQVSGGDSEYLLVRVVPPGVEACR